MTQSTFRWFLAVVGLMALAWIVLTNPARAEWPQGAFSCKAYRQDLYWQSWARRHCSGYRWRRKSWKARHRYVSPPSDPVCHRVVSATGAAAQNEDNAKARALLAWQADVAFHFGDRYLNINHAKNATVACAQAGVADTVGAKFQDAIGINHYRCRIEARPCRVEARPLRVRD